MTIFLVNKATCTLSPMCPAAFESATRSPTPGPTLTVPEGWPALGAPEAKGPWGPCNMTTSLAGRSWPDSLHQEQRESGEGCGPSRTGMARGKCRGWQVQLLALGSETIPLPHCIPPPSSKRSTRISHFPIPPMHP